MMIRYDCQVPETYHIQDIDIYDDLQLCAVNISSNALICFDIPRHSYANSTLRPPQTRATSCRHNMCLCTVKHTLCQNVHEQVKQCCGVGVGGLVRRDEKREPSSTL
jgi:hypothetical protein